MQRIEDSLQRLERFLPSQKLWMLSPETERVDMGGWRAGKTRALCTAGVFLSYLIPDNFGFIGRASGKDLHGTTIQTFFDEVCPPEMVVGKPRKIGQSGLEVILRTRFEGYTSKIYFDYIIDRSTNRSHLAGGNWGWFGVDQIEEIGRGDWHKLMGRLSRMYYHPELKKKLPIKTHALGVGNQMGHDWIFEDFFQGGDYIFDVAREPKTFFKTVRKPNRLGVIVRSEENALSNGGFVPDEYFTNLRATMPPEWIARYMDGSFDDFSGKIYSEYNLTSVHNIQPFAIPSHWPWYCYIDPGGSVPWGVGIVRVDEYGNSIIVDDAEPLYKANVNPIHALNWVKKYVPTDRARVVMDYQNIPVMQLFLDAGVYCEPAMKDRKVGLQGTQAAFHVNPARQLPPWFIESQPKEVVEKFRGKGSPQIFVFNTCRRWMKEHDDYIYDPVKKNEPKDGQRDDHCFVAGTKILTDSGERNVEDIRLGEFVVTRNGLRPVVALGSRDAVAGTAVFSNGATLTGTCDHPIWTKRGWVRLDGIRYCDTLVAWPTQSPLCLKALLSDGTQTHQTKRIGSILDPMPVGFAKGLDTFTKKFGSITMARFLKATTSTTPTKTLSITFQRIWSVLRNLSTVNFISEIHRKLCSVISQKLDPSLLSGMELAWAGDYIRESVPWVQPREKITVSPNAARFATNLSWLGERLTDFVPTTVNLRGEENRAWISARGFAEFVERRLLVMPIAIKKPALENAALVSPWKPKQKEKVYNITIVGEHEYFANGILVSNCDGTRYHLASSPQPASKLLHDPYAFRDSDPTSAVHLDQVTREIARLTRKDSIERQRNSDPCDGGDSEPQTHFISEFGGYA